MIQRKYLGFITVVFLGFLLALKPVDDDFEGKVLYSIEYDELPKEMAGYESMLPDEMRMFIKGDWQRTEQNLMGGLQVFVVNAKDSVGFMLMDMMGIKIHVPMSKEDLKKEQQAQLNTKPEVKYFDETKEILNYKCKKAVISYGDQKFTAYLTKEINVKHNEYNYLEGFPLMYEISQDGMSLKFTASSIQEQAIDDALFKVPEGYQKMSMEELEKMGQ